MPMKVAVQSKGGNSKNIEELYKNYLAVFPEEEDRLYPLSESLKNKQNIHLRSTMTGHLTANALTLSKDMHHILLIRHKSLNTWLSPGGHYDLKDEVIWQNAKRELAEETGITDIALHPWHKIHKIPLDIDIQDIPANPQKNEGRHNHFDFRYLFLLNKNEPIKLDKTEVTDFTWVPLQTAQSIPSLTRVIRKITTL